ncbi:hypothetical protein JAO76_12525 [Pontibacter sp. BT310]|uniref:DUF7793 domain-containing protein n=1 Tax=Pontibacter populi TaxID=890055 RepID=A0ABS6XD10_9BACT|nr:MULTISPECIES: hypothetical protein [Pontibacter]MBJ6119024.1 hypothetical protein [Pontibacter sp. BT310]MBR0571452.1 hypothetical protein [Microvirga sp. STS03]MBW3365878.1 hypothetical protein [Pontibacter populi]
MFIEDGILYIHYKQIENLDQHVAEDCVRARKAFTENKDYPCLVDVISIKNFTKEARDYFANEGNEGIIANAILINSTVTKMMANFYIMVNKPTNPTRMFTDKAIALEWLKQFSK